MCVCVQEMDAMIHQVSTIIADLHYSMTQYIPCPQFYIVIGILECAIYHHVE